MSFCFFRLYKGKILLLSYTYPFWLFCQYTAADPCISPIAFTERGKQLASGDLVEKGIPERGRGTGTRMLSLRACVDVHTTESLDAQHAGGKARMQVRQTHACGAPPEGRDDLEVASGKSGASSVGEESGRQVLILHTRNVLRTPMRGSILTLFIDA